MALVQPTTAISSKSDLGSFPMAARHRWGATGATRRRNAMRDSSSSSLKVVGMVSSGRRLHEEGPLERPSWAGETPLSRLVGAIIAFKPFYSLLKFGARQVFISTAEKKNIPWTKMTQEILSSQVYKEKEIIENTSLQYPDYYLNPFHAYDEGNLSWLAAAEAEPATMSMASRAIPYAKSIDEANAEMRGGWLRAIDDHRAKYSPGLQVKDILDIGCSVGVSTAFLADKFPSAKVTGLDLSPYFLAVASYKEKQRPARKSGMIRWIHAKGEDTGLPSASFDIVNFAYVMHECPQRATIALFKEAFRLLRPGGTIVITDNSPKSKVLQNLSPVLFTLMKSTEPFLDEYYTLDLDETLRSVGFTNVQSRLTDPRHRTVTGTVPL
ncbi:uncharacterized protein LOC116249096 [Nymphaea colorata]|nr:uncharacterized protein LOC116249096 [Nymphaea colorata]